MNNLRAAQEQWDGRTPLDDDLPDEHDYSGDVWFGKDDEFKAEFNSGTLESLIIIDPHLCTEGFNLSKVIDEAHETAMALWLDELAVDDEDGY